MVASIMRYVAITSLVVCFSFAQERHEYSIGENRYCEEYHHPLPGVEPEDISHQKCQEKCDNHPSCQGFLMSCATQCYLFNATCTTLVSSCYSYVGVKKTSKYKDSFLNDPWQCPQFKVAFAICIAWTAMSCCIFAVLMRPRLFDRDHSVEGSMIAGFFPYTSIQLVAADEKKKPVAADEMNANKAAAGLYCIPRRTSIEAMNPEKLARTLSITKNEQIFDDHESQRRWARHFHGVLVVSVILMVVLIIGMVNFPNDGDHRRGICGLVHRTYLPYGVLDFFSSSFVDLWTPPWIRADKEHNLLVNGKLFPALDELPEDCAKVYGTDVVDERTGPGCQAWCANVTGNVFRFGCSFPTSDLGHVYQVCNKVHAWKIVSWLPPFWGPVVAAMLGILSGIVSFAHALYVLVPRVQHRLISTRAVVEELNHDRCSVFKGSHKFPLCAFPASSDASVFRRQLQIALCGFIADIVGDVNSGINFLLRGELIYSLCLLVMASLPNLHNLFQSEGPAACLLSLQIRKFPIRDVYLLQAREGAYEGIYSLLLGIFILMRGAYFQSFQASLTTFFGISFVVATSVLSSLPHAGAASLVLQMADLDFADFRRVENIRDLQYWMRFMPVLDGLALAVAFGRTFPSFWLALVLWCIGIVIGVIGTVIDSVFEKCPSTNFGCAPDFKKSWQLMMAFVFWPLSPARLNVSRKFFEGMIQGTESKFLVCSRGCASLPPLAFYAHRWLTLVTFWTFTVLRPDRALYADTFSIIWDGPSLVHQLEVDTSETLHKLLLVFLFVIGWLALILSMVFFFWKQPHLEDAYLRSGDFTDQDYADLITSFGLAVDEPETNLPPTLPDESGYASVHH